VPGKPIRITLTDVQPLKLQHFRMESYYDATTRVIFSWALSFLGSLKGAKAFSPPPGRLMNCVSEIE
jgi:hypothetical protein